MVDQEKVREGVRLILEGIGEDINREGLIETPDRIARMYCELAGGMDQNAATHLEKRFHVDNADMVVEKDITFYSMMILIITSTIQNSLLTRNRSSEAIFILRTATSWHRQTLQKTGQRAEAIRTAICLHILSVMQQMVSPVSSRSIIMIC